MSAVRCSRGALAGVIATMALAGCSGSIQAPTSPSTATDSAAAAAPTNVQVGISPGGVTTSISAAASSFEEEYYQACHAARQWMNEKGGDPRAQVEPYLSMVQASPSGTPGTWNTPWAHLTPERQAGVIVAVQGAADGACD